MNSHSTRFVRLLAALAAVALLAGCTSYVKQADFDTAIADLQQTDRSLQQQIDGLKSDLQQMTQRFSDYDARLTVLEGRINVDNVAFFDFDKAALKDEYKPMLDEFASIMRGHHAEALVTVEGFTDPAGSRAYNERLGQRRADAVREYLVAEAGMPAAQVRAVSYGKESARQVDPGKTREDGRHNRRAVLVIDFAG